MNRKKNGVGGRFVDGVEGKRLVDTNKGGLRLMYASKGRRLGEVCNEQFWDMDV